MENTGLSAAVYNAITVFQSAKLSLISFIT